MTLEYKLVCEDGSLAEDEARLVQTIMKNKFLR